MPFPLKGRKNLLNNVQGSGLVRGSVRHFVFLVPSIHRNDSPYKAASYPFDTSDPSTLHTWTDLFNVALPSLNTRQLELSREPSNQAHTN